MDRVDQLIRRARKTQHGYTDLQIAADEVLEEHTAADCRRIAQTLFASDVHQARMLATFVLGRMAAGSAASLRFLRERVSTDGDWRVQEILAQAFERYCADTGYQRALPVIRAWLADREPNVRRAVTEGLRIWTSKPYFRDHPKLAVQLLGKLRGDQSEYVRKSVGNALRDISRRHPDLVRAELKLWDASDARVQQTWKLAGKFL